MYFCTTASISSLIDGCKASLNLLTDFEVDLAAPRLLGLGVETLWSKLRGVELMGPLGHNFVFDMMNLLAYGCK